MHRAPLATYSLSRSIRALPKYHTESSSVQSLLFFVALVGFSGLRVRRPFTEHCFCLSFRTVPRGSCVLYCYTLHCKKKLKVVRGRLQQVHRRCIMKNRKTFLSSFLIFRNRSFTGQGAPAFSDSSLPVRELSAVGRATFSCFFLFFRSLAAGGATFPVLHGIARLTVEQFAFSRSGRLFGE